MALARCRERGVGDDDLTEIARCLKAQMMFSLAYLIDSGPDEYVTDVQDITWGLFQVDENSRPFGPPIAGLYESVLEMDPTGREMRPKAPL